MQERGKRLYSTLFFSTLRLSACTFGGGFVIIPLMRRRFVEELGWLKEQEMLDMTAIAQSSPGAVAVNAAVLLGHRLAGIPGALVAALGTVLPPLVILSVISVFYEAFRSSPVVNLVMKGMLCGVAAVIADVVITLSRTIFKKKRVLPVVMMVASFIASYCFSVNVAIILLICGVTGAVDGLRRERRRKVAGA